MESKKLRFVTLLMTLALIAFILCAFFLPDFRFFLALALVVLALKSTLELSSEFILNNKTILVMVLSCSIAILGIAALYFFFSIYPGLR
jgi:hypothetical protein